MLRTKRCPMRGNQTGAIATLDTAVSKAAVRRWLALAACGALLVAGGALAGCKGDAQLSQQEVEQIKAGPPKEMPPEARRMMENAGRGGQGAPGAGNPAQPPAAGQVPNGPR